MDFAAGEDHRAINERKETVVFGATDIESRLNGSSALTDDDGPGLGFLTAVELDTQKLRIGIAAVPCRALTFFMRHDENPCLDEQDSP